ncbi:MAG: hypothetical protein GY803_20330, partial [Chloroflexi bacterium]|nr:hypothetical protein [Chloroflexota bacterium]
MNKSGYSWLKGRGAGAALILTAALIGFEIFNFDTTKYALMDLMGGLRFWGMEWAAILAFAFCGIDFTGLVRLFTPEQSMKDEPKEVWLLTGAWLLGASMNAVMTWYAVSLTIASRSVGTALIPSDTVSQYAPMFVALLVWLTRILFIGSISVAADRMLHGGGRRRDLPRRQPVREQNVR